MIRINRIGIGSAFKVSALVSGLMWAVFGLLYVLMLLPLASAGGSVQTYGTQPAAFDVGDSIAMVVLFMYACGVPLYAIIGGIFGALGAFIYNLVSGWVGGIEMEIEGYVNEPSRPHFTTGKTVSIPDRQF